MPRYKNDQREQQRNETRRALLEAAAVEFANLGFDQANINRISLAAGYSKGTIYNYFPSKRDLMLALIGEIAALHAEAMIEAARREKDPLARLERFFQAGFEFIPEHFPQAQTLITTLYGPDQEFKRAMYAAYQPFFQFVAEEILAPGIEQGLFRLVDPAEMAPMVMTVYLGTSSMVNEEGQPWLAAKRVSDFVLFGLAARSGAEMS